MEDLLAFNRKILIEELRRAFVGDLKSKRTFFEGQILNAGFENQQNDMKFHSNHTLVQVTRMVLVRSIGQKAGACSSR